MRLAVLVTLGSKRFFAAIIINGRIGSFFLPKKNQSPYPRPTTREGQPDGGITTPQPTGNLTPSTISRFCASLIPAEYSP